MHGGDLILNCNWGAGQGLQQGWRQLKLLFISSQGEVDNSEEKVWNDNIPCQGGKKPRCVSCALL